MVLPLLQDIALFAMPHRPPFPNFPLLKYEIKKTSAVCKRVNHELDYKVVCVSIYTSRFLLTGYVGLILRSDRCGYCESQYR